MTLLTFAEAIAINSYNRGVPRTWMPQFDGQEDIDAFAQYLQASGIKVNPTSLHARQFKPSQFELNMDKVANLASKANRDPVAFRDREIIVSKDFYILDGHHYWAAANLVDPEMDIPTRIVDLTFEQLLHAARKFINN